MSDFHSGRFLLCHKPDWSDALGQRDVPENLEDIGRQIGAWASGEPDAVLDEWYDKCGGGNPNGDPKEIVREGLQSGVDRGRIKMEMLSSDGMKRKSQIGKIEPMPKKQFHRIVKNFKAHGGIIQYNDETDQYLASKHAEAITYDDKTILIKQHPGRASVFEELIHATQYRNGENDGSYESRLICEIMAQEKLLRNARAYELTDAEIIQTRKALEAYQNELNDYHNRGGV